MSWHIDEPTLAAYTGGRAGATAAASAEAHLTSCADCRALLAPAVDPGRLAAIWDQVDDRLDVASLPWFDRTLVRVGVGEGTARLLAATPSLTTSWLGSLAVAVVFAVLAADSTANGLLGYLTLAPMLPVAGVAAAYGRLADPAHELAVAAPYSLFRLLLLRSVAVVGSTVVIIALGSLALLGHGWTAVAWLLPALALSTMTFALSAWVTPVWAAAGVLTTWVALVLVVRRAGGDDLAAFGAAGQLVALVVVGLAALAVVRERPTFAFDRRSST
jgi:hypothetical protein